VTHPARLRQRPLGGTGLSVSELGFGCGPTAALMVDGPPELQRAVVARALELGINYFDTAPTYGSGASEANLGRCLRELGARPTVATKVAITAADLDRGDGLAAVVERSVETSLERLGLASVPIVQLHNRVGRERAPQWQFGTGALLTVDDVLGPRGVAAGLRRLRDRGLAEWFGCSAFGGDMEVVTQLVDSGAFDVLTVHYSLANPTAWPAPPEPAFLFRDSAEMERRLVQGGASSEPAFLFRDAAEMERRLVLGGASSEPAFLFRDAAEMERRLEAEGASGGGGGGSAADVNYQGIGARAAAAGLGVVGLRVLEGGRLAGGVDAALRFALGNPELACVIVGFSDLGQVEQAAAVSYSL
jgi:aryl-alcohol dehydrogenase-like predicted oxidoreductase